MIEKYFIDVYKTERPDFPILSLNPKSFDEFERWEKDIKALYNDYHVRSGVITYERY